MVRRQRVNPRLDVGEILLDQRRHVGIQALLEARIGSRLRPRALAVLLTDLFRKPTHDVKVPGIPSHARQLPRSIGNARRQT